MGIKVSALPAATAAQGSEISMVIQGGVSKKINAAQDIIDLRAFGAVADGTTDCAPALILAKAFAPAGALIWLKNRGTGVYRFDNSSTELFEDCQLYVEDNVVISIMQGTAVNINSVTPFTLRWEVLGNQENTLYPNSPLRDALDIENLKDAVIVREPFDASVFTEYGFGSWTQDATKGSIPGNLTIDSAKKFTVTGISTTNGLRVGEAPATPGATLSACCRASTAGFGVIWVQNSYGASICVDGGDFNIFKYGDPDFQIAYSLPAGYAKELKDNGSYLNYDPSKSVAGIKLHEDGINFEFLNNGVNRSGHIITLGGLPIEKWGFGGYGHGGVGSSVIWYDFILEYKRRKEPFEDIQIQIFGDSQSVEYVGQSWPTLLQSMLNNSYGNRITRITNYAISGQTTTQQKAVFDATAHLGITIFFAGTNDIQGQTSITTMLSNLDGILAALDFTNQTASATVGVIDPGKNRLLLVIPPMFFSQALNGGQGQASSNYELGGAYRMAMLRWAAENDVTVVDLMTALGATTRNSNVMRDDIHFVDLGAAIAAKEIAKQLLILKSKVNANTVIVGDSKSTLHIIKEATPPADTSTIVKWINVYIGGVEHKMPLYV